MFTPPSAFDLAVSHALQAAQPPALTALMKFASLAGSPEVLMAVAALAAILLWVRGRRWGGAVVAAMTAGDFLTPILKKLIDRPRPTPADVHVLATDTDPSFPSGHALAAVLFVAAVWVMTSNLPAAARGRWRGAAIVIVIAVGYSRVYLGAHWLTDVLGGFAVGLAWIALVRTAERAWISRRLSR